MTSLPLSVAGSWLGPVMEHFQAMAETGDLDELQKLVDQIPDLYDSMDHDALAATLERAMGAAAIYGAMNSKGADLLTGLASDEYETGVAFMPFEAAAAALDRKTPIGSKLNSLQWQGVPAELRSRAMLSSRVESIRFLAESRTRLSSELRLQREQLANGKQAFFSRDSFIVEMRKLAEAEGIDTTNGTFDGSIRDIRSAQRLGLIYDINTEQAENHARYKMDLDPDVLDAYPAKRLVRLEDREHKRNWIEIWRAAANEVDWVGVASGGNDMVALKTSPIWTRLGPFGNPYPPYDWGSGMGDEDVPREEAESLGLLKAGEDVPTPPETEAFNRRMEMGIEEDAGNLVNRLQEDFGDQVQLSKGRVRWQGNIISDLVQDVQNLNPASPFDTQAFKGRAINLGAATDSLVKLGSKAGIDMADSKMVIKPDSVYHILKAHGEGRETIKGQRGVTKLDFELLPHIWRNPDSLKSGNKPRSIEITKKIMGTTRVIGWNQLDNGVYYPNTMYVKTAGEVP